MKLPVRIGVSGTGKFLFSGCSGNGAVSGGVRTALLAVLLILGLAVLLAGCDGAKKASGVPKHVAGVHKDRVRLGSSLPLTGHASYLGTQTLRGALSYINTVNADGGVHGRTIELDARDDGYDPPRCLANTQQFLISQDIFALFGYVGTPTTVRILPLVEDTGIPLLGMFTGANALREPFNPYVLNVRASYYQETKAIVDYLVNKKGLTRIAVFYQYDAYGFDGLTGTELALRELGLAPVARGSYVRGTNDIAEGLGRIVNSDAQAVVLVGTYEPCAQFIRQAEEAGMNAMFCNLSFVGGNELARRLGNTRNTVMMTQVVPPPQDARSRVLLGFVDDYVRDMQRWFPEDTPNTVGLEGYINAKVLVEGLRRAGKNLTRERFIDALESMTSFPLGGEAVVAFSPGDHQGLERVYFTQLEDGHFVLMADKLVADHLVAAKLKKLLEKELAMAGSPQVATTLGRGEQANGRQPLGDGGSI